MQDLSDWTPRKAPAPVALTGRFAMIEPYHRIAHGEALWQAFGGEGINEFLHYFPSGPFSTVDGFCDWIDASVKAGLVVNVIRARRTGDVVGMGSYMRADPANGVVEIGSVAHSAAMARSPVSTEAHYLLARHIFEDLDYRRYEWKCHNDNEASKVTARRLGFTFEGLFRQHIISKGENRDTAWFSIIDGEWPLVRGAFDAWLAADNFDATGAQKRRLEDIRAELAGEK